MSNQDAIFPVLAELGIGATLYGVLSRGLLSASPIGAGDGRAHMPRFTGANHEANARLVAGLQGLAKRWGITPSQLAIVGRWASSRSSCRRSACARSSNLTKRSLRSR